MLAVFLAVYLGIQLGLPNSFRTGNNSTDDYIGAVLMNAICEKQCSGQGSECLSSVRTHYTSLGIPSPGISAMERSQYHGAAREPGRRRLLALEGVTVRKLDRNVESVAELHAVISSSRGQYLHRRLLSTP